MKTVLVGTDHYDQPKKEEIKPFPCSFLLYDPNLSMNPKTYKILCGLFKSENMSFTGFKENYVLQSYHPLVYHQEGKLNYYGLRKNDSSFTLTLKKEFQWDELQDFCQKMPWEMGQVQAIEELSKGGQVEWKLGDGCIVRSFQQGEMTYLYLQELIDIDPRAQKLQLNLENEVKSLSKFFKDIYAEKALFNYLVLFCSLNRIRIDENALIKHVEPMITSFQENQKKHFNTKYNEEFLLRGFCGDMLLQLPDFNEETGNFSWDKFEQPLKKQNLEPENEQMAQILKQVNQQMSELKVQEGKLSDLKK